jgi:hypothetical protein
MARASQCQCRRTIGDDNDTCTVRNMNIAMVDSCTVSKVCKDQLEVTNVDLSYSYTVSEVCKSQLKQLKCVGSIIIRSPLHIFLYRHIYI